MLKSLKDKAKSKAKIIVMTMTISIMTVLSCFAVGAEDTVTTTATLQDSFGTALATIQSDILAIIALALPVGLAIFGTVVAIKKGISFVRSLIGK